MHFIFIRTIVTLLLLMLIIPSSSAAGEYSIASFSTVVGRNTAYPSGTTVNGTTQIGDVDLIFETTLYAKNLELVHVEIEGETFIGSLTPIRLRYRPHDQLTLEAGALLGYDFGDGGEYDEAEPILRLVFQPRPYAYAVAGTIIRTHSIHDALLNDTAAFNENNEQGFQFRIDSEWLKQDFWINWRIKEESAVSERFDTASVTKFILNDLHLDAQVIIRHAGGQKNTEDKIEYNTAYLVGGSYGFLKNAQIPFLKHIKELRIGAHYIGDYDAPDNQSGLDSTDGKGVEGSIVLITRPSEDRVIHVFGSYFHGDNLITRAGDPIYQKDEYAQIGSNFVLTFPSGLIFELGVVGQIINGTFAHTEQMYFSWGKGFTLFKGK